MAQTVNPTRMEMLRLRKRLVGAQVIDPTAALTSDAAFNDLEDLFGAVSGVDAVYAPRQLLSKYKSLARSVGGAEYINSEITGKREWTWNGVPFIDPGQHWAGHEILGYDVALGGDLFAMKFANSFAEEGVMGITNGGLTAYSLGELQEKPAIRTRIDFYCGMAVQGGKAAARLRGVKLT